MFTRRVELGENGDGLIRRIREAKTFGFDTESSGPKLVGGKKSMINMHLATLTGMSFAFPDNTSFYVPVRHMAGRNAQPQFISALKKELAPSKAEIWIHNAKHEMKAMGWSSLPANARCSLILAWMLGYANQSRLGLKELMRVHHRWDMSTFDEVTDGFPFETLDPQAKGASGYACHDAEAHFTLGTWLKTRKHLSEQEWKVFLEQEMPFVEVANDMELRGMAIDPDRLKQTEMVILAELDRVTKEWDKHWPFVKIGSTKDLRDFYADGTWTTKGVDEKKEGLSCDKRAMETQVLSLDPSSPGYKAAQLRLEYSQLAILRSTFTSTLAAQASQYPDGRLHPNVNQTGTATGRISMSNPNLQNIPTRSKLGKAIRDAFIAAPGCKLLVWDYSQIELRILAHLAGGALAEAYRNGIDLHQQTADFTGLDRGQAKNVNFAKVYQASDPKLAYMCKLPLQQMKKALSRYEDAYPEIDTLKHRYIRACKQQGYVKTISGRRRYIPEINSENRGLMKRGERKAFNTPIQGSSGDITKLAMLAMYRAGFQLVNQVHDEIVAEDADGGGAREMLELGKSLMKKVVKLRVPVEVSGHICDRWSEAK